MADYDNGGSGGLEPMTGVTSAGGDGYDRDRSRSPLPPPRDNGDYDRRDDRRGGGGGGGDRDDYRRSERERSPRRRPPPPPAGKQDAATPSNVLGCFGLSIRTKDIDLEDEFSRYGQVEKAVIVYDQRSERSRGFGFVTMASIEDAQRCIEKLNGIELHGRHIRVAFSMTHKPHASTPGQYMGFKDERDRRGGSGGGYGGAAGGYDRYRRDDRDRERDPRRRDRDDDRRPPRYDDRERDRDRERDYRRRDDRDRDYDDRRPPRRSPSPRRRSPSPSGARRQSPSY